MAKPKRTFTGQEGQRSTGTAGPDAIRNDFDAAFAMFDPDATLPDGSAGGIGTENIRPGAVTDAILGDRVINDKTTPSSDTGTLTALLSGLANRIKAIVGGSNWRANPATTLAAAASHISASAPHSGHALKSDLDAHIKDKSNPHGVTPAQIGAATETALNAHINNKSNPHSVTAAQVGALVSVAGISNPGGNVDIVAGTGITVSKDTTNKRITITATGGQAPAEHGSSHEQGGADPIPSLPTESEKAALAGTYGTPSATNRYVTDSDPRLTDARTPLAHTHSASDITTGTISANRLPSASTTAKGIVQLSTATNSTSTTMAATPSAVKAAYDLAASKADAVHTHSASDITSGTIAAARLPSASTSAAGIVQLTTSRTSSSTTLALAASAMQAHIASGDHDSRYYTKSQVDNLLSSVSGSDDYWMQPSSDVLTSLLTSGTHYIPADETSEEYGRVVAEFIPFMRGKYRVLFEVNLQGAGATFWLATPDYYPINLGYGLSNGSIHLSNLWATNLCSSVYSTASTWTQITLDMAYPVQAGQRIWLVVSAYVSSTKREIRNIRLCGTPTSAPDLKYDVIASAYA